MDGCNFAGCVDTSVMNWDDLKIVRAVYRAGSYAAAAKQLKLNETTVSRRLGRLERDLGYALFEAADGSRRPTSDCEKMIGRIEGIASEMDLIEHAAATETGLVGRRRIAATDSISSEVLAPNTGAFLDTNPGVKLDFLVSTANVNFSRWEADLAIRLANPDKGDFLVSKLADIDLYLIEPAATGERAAITVGFPEDLNATPESRLLQDGGTALSQRVATKNLLVQRQLIRSGRFRGIMMAHACADLVANPAYKVTRLPEKRGIWLLVQPHLRHDTLTRRVIDWIKDCFQGV